MINIILSSSTALAAAIEATERGFIIANLPNGKIRFTCFSGDLHRITENVKRATTQRL